MKVVTFLKEVRSELAQVSWPPALELWGSARVVLVSAGLLAGIIWFFDLICSQLVRLVLG